MSKLVQSKLSQAKLTRAKLTRRGFIVTGLAATSVRSLPTLITKPAPRRILTLVYDKSLGMMRAIERLVP